MQTIKEAVDALKSGKTTSEKLVQDSISTFEADKKSDLPLNAFIEMYDDALKLAKAADEEIAKARTEGSLDSLFEKKPLFYSSSNSYISLSCFTEVRLLHIPLLQLLLVLLYPAKILLPLLQ